jgi:hypothetical protein
VDAGRTQKRILEAHLPNQFANLLRHRRAPGLALTSLLGPKQPEAHTMPANDGLRLDDLKNLASSAVRSSRGSGVMRSGSCSPRVIPARPWRLKNWATMIALCRIVLAPRS